MTQTILLRKDYLRACDHIVGYLDSKNVVFGLNCEHNFLQFDEFVNVIAKFRSLKSLKLFGVVSFHSAQVARTIKCFFEMLYSAVKNSQNLWSIDISEVSFDTNLHKQPASFEKLSNLFLTHNNFSLLKYPTSQQETPVFITNFYVKFYQVFPCRRFISITGCRQSKKFEYYHDQAYHKNMHVFGMIVDASTHSVCWDGWNITELSVYEFAELCRNIITWYPDTEHLHVRICQTRDWGQMIALSKAVRSLPNLKTLKISGYISDYINSYFAGNLEHDVILRSINALKLSLSATNITKLDISGLEPKFSNKLSSWDKIREIKTKSREFEIIV